MSRTRSITRAIPVVLLAAIAVGVGFIVGIGPQPTDASWTVTKTLAVTATALTPAAPTGLSCPGNGLLASAVPFNWTAPAGTPPSSYTLTWTGASSGSTNYTGPSGSVTSPLGTIAVSVYANYGNWQSSAGTQIRHVTGVIFVGWTCGP